MLKMPVLKPRRVTHRLRGTFPQCIPMRRDRTLCEDLGIDNYDNPELSGINADQYIQLLRWYRESRMRWDGAWKDLINCRRVKDFNWIKSRVESNFGANSLPTSGE